MFAREWAAENIFKDLMEKGQTKLWFANHNSHLSSGYRDIVLFAEVLISLIVSIVSSCGLHVAS